MTEQNKQPDLTKHLRQFQHNDGSGFVFAYDKDGIDTLIASLTKEHEQQPICMCGYIEKLNKPMPLHITEEGEELLRLLAEVASLKEDYSIALRRIVNFEDIVAEYKQQLAAQAEQIAELKGPRPWSESPRYKIAELNAEIAELVESAVYQRRRVKDLLTPSAWEEVLPITYEQNYEGYEHRILYTSQTTATQAAVAAAMRKAAEVVRYRKFNQHIDDSYKLFSGSSSRDREQAKAAACIDCRDSILAIITADDMQAVMELERDAERYRKLRQQQWNESELCVVMRPKEAVKLGYDCPSLERLDAFVDALPNAIKKE
jgi:hypothetical protein